MLCDRFHGAVKGHFNVNCTNMVLNVHIEALYWCNITIVVQPFCTMPCMITPFGGDLKVGTDFALQKYGKNTAKIWRTARP
jgi:hypothetical protein